MISGAPQPWLGASMTAQRIVPSETIDSTAPTGSNAVCAGSRDSGTSMKPSTRPTITIGTLTMKIDPHQKCSSRKPPVMGPSPMPSADTPADTHQRASRDQRVGRWCEGRERGADAEDEEAEGEEAVAPESVAEASGGQQQPGEHEDVAVDHPLQLARRGPQAALALRVGEGRNGDVQDRVVEGDHDQADAQDEERQPTPPVDEIRVP